MSPSITLHGLMLDADDALRLTIMALGESAEALDTANTFHGYNVAAGFLRSTMVDAMTRFGLSLADVVRYTELGPEIVLGILDEFDPGAWEQSWKPYEPGSMS